MNHCPPVVLCLDSNKDQGTGEHLANMDQMAIHIMFCLHRVTSTSVWRHCDLINAFTDTANSQTVTHPYVRANQKADTYPVVRPIVT